MEEKTLLGIGYILSIIPVISIIGSILIIIGWVKLGNKHKENLWKWVGYSAILAIIAVILMFSTFIGSLLTGNIGAILASFTMMVPVLALYILYGILQLIGLWKAGTKFNSGLLKAGGILSIIPILNFLGYLLAAVGFLTLKE